MTSSGMRSRLFCCGYNILQHRCSSLVNEASYPPWISNIFSPTRDGQEERISTFWSARRCFAYLLKWLSLLVLLLRLLWDLGFCEVESSLWCFYYICKCNSDNDTRLYLLFYATHPNTLSNLHLSTTTWSSLDVLVSWKLLLLLVVD